MTTTTTTATNTPSFSEELRLAAGDQWTRIVTHQFTTELAAGTISKDALSRYLIQDHRFLDAFIVLLASTVASAHCLEDRIEGCQFLAILTGTENTYFQRAFVEMNISEDDRTAIPNAAVTNRFLKLMTTVATESCSSVGDKLAVLCVCEWTYLCWGQTVESRTKRDTSFVCYEWVDLHCGDYFASVVAYLRRLLDDEGARLDDAGRDKCRKRFLETVQLEEDFFDYAYSGDAGDDNER